MADDATFPLVLHLPHEVHAPIEIETGFAGLRMVYLPKSRISMLTPEWDARGAYVLLGPSEDAGCYWARVGKSSPGKLRQRVGWHVRNTKTWDRALLIASTVGNGFNSAQAGYLEGRLTEILDAAPAAQVHAKRRDKDDTLEDWQQAELEPGLQVVTAVMRLIGYPPDTLDQQEDGDRPPGTKRSRSETSVADLIEAKLIKPGTSLRARWGGYGEKAEVQADGNLVVEGSSFTSPSGAAKHVTGRATNGWDFWVVPSGDGSLRPLATLRERLDENGGDGRTRDAEPPAPEQDQPREGREKSAGKEPVDPYSPEGRKRNELGRLMETGALPRDADFVATYKGKAYKAYSTGSGEICLYTAFTDGDDPEPGSPSGVAKQVTGRATNGRTFWRVVRPDGTTPTLDEVRKHANQRRSS